MAPPSTAAALALPYEQSAPSPAAERLATLMALPLRAEPETEEEAAIFEEADADIRAERKGYAPRTISALIDEMRRAAGG